MTDPLDDLTTQPRTPWHDFANYDVAHDLVEVLIHADDADYTVAQRIAARVLADFDPEVVLVAVASMAAAACAVWMEFSGQTADDLAASTRAGVREHVAANLAQLDHAQGDHP